MYVIIVNYISMLFANCKIFLVTLVVVLATVVLIYFEVTYYTSSDIVFSYDVDNDINE